MLQTSMDQYCLQKLFLRRFCYVILHKKEKRVFYKHVEFGLNCLAPKK